MTPLNLSRIGPALAICILLVVPAFACPMDNGNGGHYVKFHFLNASGTGELATPLVNVTVYITPSNTIQEYAEPTLLNWFQNKQWKDSDDVSNRTSFVTTDKGEIETVLYSVQKYNVTVMNKTYYLYSVDSEYYFMVR